MKGLSSPITKYNSSFILFDFNTFFFLIHFNFLLFFFAFFFFFFAFFFLLLIFLSLAKRLLFNGFILQTYNNFWRIIKKKKGDP